MGELWRRLGAWWRRESVDAELGEELQFHLDMKTRETGDPAEARRAIGNSLQVRDQARDAWGWRWLDDTLWDIRYAARQVRRHPGFAAAVLLTLALGIGINTAVFTISNAIVFKGSPSVDRNDRIVYIGTGGPCCVSYPDFEDWRAQAQSFVGIGAVADLRITLTDQAGPAETSGATQVTANTFKLIGRTPAIGRDFAAADEAPGATPVAILSDAFWERRYLRESSVVGETIRINGVATTVIGVMPPGFSFPQKQDLWVPLVPASHQQRGDRGLWFAFGRLAQNVTVEGARAEMDAIGARLAAMYPVTNRRVLPVVMTFQQFYFGPHATTLYGALWVAVGFVLLIACINVAHLLTARAIGRSRELSLRIALGAGRGRLVRQLLIESVLLSCLGGIGGWWLAKGGVRAYELVATAPTLYWADQLVDYSLDYRVFAYAVAISIGTGLLFGIWPALRLSKLDVTTALKAARLTAIGGRPTQLRTLLVTGEMALAVVLLAGAGVMIRSFLNVYSADIGAQTDRVLTMLVRLPDATYPRSELQITFFERLARRLEALPGVESTAIAWRVPTQGALRLRYEVPDARDHEQPPTLSALVVSPGYFRTLGATVLEGRDFTNADDASNVPVAIVNQQFARMQWPREDAVGKHLRLFEDGPGSWLTVVGVASNIVQNATRQEFDPLIYVPYRQRVTDSMWVLARTRVTPDSLSTTVRREMQALDADLPVWIGPFALSDRLAATYWNRGLFGMLFAIFAALAVLLASVGLYAVVAHTVSERTQEIGIRTAVGATTRDIVILILKQGMAPVAVGLSVGIPAAVAVTPILRSQLVNVSPADPISLIVAVGSLVMSAALGCWIPMRRAVRVDLTVALRHE